MINSANLQAFDFGKKKNEEVYGTPDPPVYDVKKVTAPVVTYWGDNDWLAQPPVSSQTSKKLITDDVYKWQIVGDG